MTEEGPQRLPEGRIFVSHSSLDQPFIEEHILPVLEANDGAFFYSKDGIKGSVDWENELRRQLDECGYLLVVVSRDSLDPGCYVRDEVMCWIQAHREAQGVISVVLDETEPTKLGLKLVRLNHISFEEPGERPKQRPTEALATVAPAEPVAEAIASVELDPRLRSHYLRWLVSVHESVAVTVAGERVEADSPTFRCPIV